jgi:hypothetical protein
MNCVTINREIERLISNKMQTIGKKSGKEYGTLVHGNRMISNLVFARVPVSKTDLIGVTNLKIELAFEDVLAKMGTAISTHFQDNILATLFKNKTKCDTIKQLCV